MKAKGLDRSDERERRWEKMRNGKRGRLCAVGCHGYTEAAD